MACTLIATLVANPSALSGTPIERRTLPITRSRLLTRQIIATPGTPIDRHTDSAN